MLDRSVVLFRLLAAAVLVACLASCGSDRTKDIANSGGEGAALRKDELSQEEKSRLVDLVAGDASLNPADRREKLKSIAWQAGNGHRVRTHAIDLLAADASDPSGTDTRTMLALMLGVEPDRAVIDHACELAAARGWTDLAPSIVRCYARKLANTPEAERAERAALTKLFPDRSVESSVFEVFAAPEIPGGGLSSERTEKARQAAWEVLTRLDKDGSARRRMLESTGTTGGPAMADLKAAARELGVVPLSAMELAWLRQLRAPGCRAWWGEVSSIVSRLDAPQRERLALRHLEPLRWAAANRPQWLDADRAALTAEINNRLKGRDTHIRTEEGGDAGPGSDRFKDNAARMAWGDLLNILVIDESVRLAGASLAADLWKQAKDDQNDTTTEHGGLFTLAASGVALRAYPPRATQRLSDTRFVASDEMMQDGPTALAHYHFHAQKDTNDEYAGPSAGDVDFARDSGRLCLVITPVKPGVMNIDVYQGDALRADLGTIGTR